MWPEYLPLVRPSEKQQKAGHIDSSAMAYTSLSRRYLYNLIGARMVPSYKVGSRVFLKKGDLDEFMAKNKRESI